MTDARCGFCQRELRGGGGGGGGTGVCKGKNTRCNTLHADQVNMSTIGNLDIRLSYKQPTCTQGGDVT